MKGRIPSLNGWRAISILLVLGFHTSYVAGVPKEYSLLFSTWIDGILGVCFFFSISGFLITWLMLAEEAEHKNLSLKNFYIRRSLRIWPVYFALLGLLLILQVSGLDVQSAESWRGLLTFTRNFYNRNAGNVADWTAGHVWSLSIEEQFYLFWPLIFRLAGKRARIGVLLGAIAFSIGFRTMELLGWYGRSHGQFVFQGYSTFNYLDWLAWGCLAAFALAAGRVKLQALAEKHSTVIFSICFSAILIPYLAQVGRGVEAIGFIGLLVHSVLCPDWGFYRVLNFKWMERTGVLSYSIYIWQQLVWWLWPSYLERVWFLWIPAAFGLAWLSYELLEKPFFALRSKFRNPNMKIPGALSLAEPGL